MEEDGKMIYEYIIDKYTVKGLKRQGLTCNGIIAFADQIMLRYFNTEYLDRDDVRALNGEGEC